jgi:flagellar protein FlaG
MMHLKERKVMSIDRIPSHSSSTCYETKQNQPKADVSVILKKAETTALEEQNETHEIHKEKLEEVVKGINEFLQPSHTSLKFELHDELKEYYVQIIDERTREVIREIPPKKLLDMYATMMQFVGLIVDKKI